MSCGNCVQEVAPAISPQRVSAPATGGKERDGYPFSLASLLGPDYLRLDFTTTSKEPLESNDTLLWLNRGLGWGYGFNHEEAKFCFEKAIESDPNCPMAYWGKAWTSNVNYNKPVCLEPEDATAREAAIMAKKVAAEFGKDWEKALCDAMYLRHVVEGHPEVVRKDPSGRDILNKAYAEAMQSVYDKFYLPSYDPDIAAITAEAHMQLSPWKLWPYHPGVNDAEHFTHATDIPTLTSHILNILESGFNDRESNKHHTGLVHFWIHVWEMSPTPERGLPLANWLRTSTLGGAGHLAHMPSHLDVLCGRYKEAVRSNELALEADHRFLEYRPQTFYNAYIQHDAHLLVYAAMFQGSFRSAFSAAQEVAALSSDHMVKNWPDFFESYLPVPLHVLIRFGKFEEVLLLPFPEDPVLYCTTTASLHYARGIAHAALGDTSAARAEQSLFREARTKVAPSRMHFQVKADEIMAIAEEMLEGEILYREGKHEEAYARLRRGVELDDGLAYMEPWGWMVPVRHALAALLLDQGHADRALPIYRADMAPTKHPDNIWSLRGLLECLEKLGKGAEKCPGETEEVRRKVAERAKDADVQVEVSCYCRR